MKFSEYRAFTVPVPVSLTTGHTITLDVAPSRYAGDFGKKMADPEVATKVTDAAYIAHLVASWDIEDEKGHQIAVDEAWIAQNIGNPDQVRIVKAIMETLFPNARIGQGT